MVFGFIKAFTGSVGGMLADQWLDYLTPPTNLPPSAAIFPAVKRGTDAGRGANVKGSENIISNGSRIVVPEGYGLMTFQDGELTGFIGEPGGFIFTTDDPQAQSVFAGGDLLGATLKQSWERFKFGGQPAAQQLAFYVNLKEIPDNRFGTQSEIYWDDAYLGAQVGAITRGTYTMRIVDPILFVKGFVPYTYLQPDAPVFDFGDFDNPAASQLFNEVVSSLAPALSNYTNDPSKGNRISKIQGDSLGFAQSLSGAVEAGYQWASGRGLVIVSVAITSIEYDEDTRKLLSDVKKADALSGRRGASFMQQSMARGFESAGESGGATGIAMMGMGAGVVGAGGAMNYQQQGPPPYQNPFQQGQYPPPQGQYPPQQGQYPPPQGQYPPQQGQYPPQQPPQAPPAPPQEDPVAKLAQYKEMLDQGLISQEDFDAAKRRALGLE